MQADSQEEERTLVSKGSLAEVVVQAATACNKLITENCGVCTLYCDKQVQYEAAVMEQYVTGNALSNVFRSLDQRPELKEYKDMLFDEQSVVQSVSSRQED